LKKKRKKGYLRISESSKNNFIVYKFSSLNATKIPKRRSAYMRGLKKRSPNEKGNEFHAGFEPCWTYTLSSDNIVK
jgi:hypothetical protein